MHLNIILGCILKCILNNPFKVCTFHFASIYPVIKLQLLSQSSLKFDFFNPEIHLNQSKASSLFTKPRIASHDEKSLSATLKIAAW